MKPLAIAAGVLCVAAIACTIAGLLTPMTSMTVQSLNVTVENGPFETCTRTAGTRSCVVSDQHLPCEEFVHEVRSIMVMGIIHCVLALVACGISFAVAFAAVRLQFVLFGVLLIDFACGVASWSVQLCLWLLPQCAAPQTLQEMGAVIGPSFPLLLCSTVLILLAAILTILVPSETDNSQQMTETIHKIEEPVEPPAFSEAPALPPPPLPAPLPATPKVLTPRQRDAELSEPNLSSLNDWTLDSESRMYYSPTKQRFWDPATQLEFDPQSRNWYRPDPPKTKAVAKAITAISRLTKGLPKNSVTPQIQYQTEIKLYRREVVPLEDLEAHVTPTRGATEEAHPF